MSKLLHPPKNDRVKLSNSFTAKEFDCHCSGLCNITDIHTDLITILQSLRDLYGEPIRITSGYRCEIHNRSIGGVENSSHCKGLAADLQCSDLDRLADLINTHYSKCSLGRYDSFLHFDIRQDSRRWDKRSKQEYLPSGPTEDDIDSILDDIESDTL